MEPGDVIHIHSPGGGGRGDPLDREPERVALDVRRGYVSPAAAEAAYGVVIRGGGVDMPATAALRASRRVPARAHFSYGPERDAHDAIWTEDGYGVLTGILAALPVHWRFFVKTKMFAEMRDHPGCVRSVFAAVRRSYPEIPEVPL